MSKTKLLDLLEEINPAEYIIYCDLDGVLVDFDKGYEEITGKRTHHTDRQGSQYFWDLYRQGLKDKGMTEREYWENLPWMKDGKQMWDYIKSYNPFVLTAPSVNPEIPKPERYKISHNESMQGKTEWVKRLDNMRAIKFKASNFKKHLAKPNRILIDDRKPTIEQWRAKGGIGIHHTSAQDTINQLKKLGL